MKDLHCDLDLIQDLIDRSLTILCNLRNNHFSENVKHTLKKTFTVTTTLHRGHSQSYAISVWTKENMYQVSLTYSKSFSTLVENKPLFLDYGLENNLDH